MAVFIGSINTSKKKKGAYVIEVSLNPSIEYNVNTIPNDYDSFSTLSKAKSEIIRQLKMNIAQYNSAIKYIQKLNEPNR